MKDLWLGSILWLTLHLAQIGVWRYIYLIRQIPWMVLPSAGSKTKTWLWWPCPTYSDFRRLILRCNRSKNKWVRRTWPKQPQNCTGNWFCETSLTNKFAETDLGFGLSHIGLFQRFTLLDMLGTVWFPCTLYNNATLAIKFQHSSESSFGENNHVWDARVWPPWSQNSDKYSGEEKKENAGWTILSLNSAAQAAAETDPPNF